LKNLQDLKDHSRPKKTRWPCRGRYQDAPAAPPPFEAMIREIRGLHSACMNGNEDTVEMMLDMGADLSIRALGGFTPEGIATLYGHEHIVALLRAVATRRARGEAFSMGQHARLGASSLILGLEPAVVRLILDQA